MREILQLLISFKRRIERLERSVQFRTLVFPDDGQLVIPKMASDPSSPVDGEIWYNTTSNTFKCRENGTTKTFTTS